MNRTARVALLGAALLALPAVAWAQAPTAPDSDTASRHATHTPGAQPRDAAAERARIAKVKARSEAAVEAARASGDVPKEAEALANLGSVYMMTGHHAKGMETLTASADLYAQIGNDEMATKIRKLVQMVQSRSGH